MFMHIKQVPTNTLPDGCLGQGTLSEVGTLNHIHTYIAKMRSTMFTDG